MFGGEKDDFLNGGLGNDHMRGQAGNDWLLGNDGNDSLWGGAGDDHLQGMDGDDLIWGGAGDDLITGRRGVDILWGGAGNDWLSGNWEDRLLGGDGKDVLIGGAELIGGAGIDGLYDDGNGDSILRGGTGDDFLFSALDLHTSGYGDRLFGGAGDDIFVADNTDILTGGAGADEFVLGLRPGNGVAEILDFSLDQGDTLTLFRNLVHGNPVEEGMAFLGARDQMEYIFWKTVDLSDKVTLTASYDGTATVISFFGEDLVYLHDITVAELEAATDWLLPYS